MASLMVDYASVVPVSSLAANCARLTLKLMMVEADRGTPLLVQLHYLLEFPNGDRDWSDMIGVAGCYVSAVGHLNDAGTSQTAPANTFDYQPSGFTFN